MLHNLNFDFSQNSALLDLFGISLHFENQSFSLVLASRNENQRKALVFDLVSVFS